MKLILKHLKITGISNLSWSFSRNNAEKPRQSKFELKNFSGDPKQLFTFWSIFSKIHESDDLSEINKFQNLYQSMLSNSRTATLISSFPTTENYPKVIQQQKIIFGHEDLSVKIYVRDLSVRIYIQDLSVQIYIRDLSVKIYVRDLSIVMKNARKKFPDLAILYELLLKINLMAL
ncbi:uncharacterized protein NPIL_508661 [Nephila pilipes]|uniref:Uncharacterized protein n=1 Tax=Nephila pilipes TaxID=299642 RepID=A0A8X6INQ6_NEPPI|nr:uncharacterized protein NPIL_607371 [Nephila pilipes]GFU16795.1 uncharacterized protein NPIL_508661 [Nephila pilipes]